MISGVVEKLSISSTLIMSKSTRHTLKMDGLIVYEMCFRTTDPE